MKKNEILSKKQSGFTLIELMIAMAIIAILTTAGLSAYTGYLKKGRDSVRGTLASRVNTEVMNYAASNGGNPPADETAFDAFLQSAAGAFGSGDAEADLGSIFHDPLGGWKDVCLDADENATEPCSFHYTAYADGTYAISYGIESRSSMKKNFYRTTSSIPDPVDPDTKIEKYGVYIGTAAYIGGPVTTPETHDPVDPPGIFITSYTPPRIDIITNGGGGIPDTYTLSITPNGATAIEINSEMTDDFSPKTYPLGTSLVLVGYSNLNNPWEATIWWESGCDNWDNDPSCALTMNSNKNMTPIFPIYYTLTTNAGPGGSISGNNSPYPQFFAVGITAVPNEGYHFVSWNSHCAFLTSSLCAFTITGNTSLTATFEPD